MDDYEHKEWAYVAGLITGLIFSWHVPFWVAARFDQRDALEALTEQSGQWEAWLTIAFHVGLIISGGIIATICIVFVVLVTYGFWKGLVFIGQWLWQIVTTFAEALAAAIEWLARAIIGLIGAILLLIWEILSWPFRFAFGLLADLLGWLTGNVKRHRDERRKLKEAYAQKYAQDFRSFRAFLKYWKALKRGENPPYPEKEEEFPFRWADEEEIRQRKEAKRRTEEQRQQQKQRGRQGSKGSKKSTGKRDPYQAALSLLGLSEPFTKAELGARYKMAMKKTHPDLCGDERLATRLNMARDLIMKKKGWK